MLASVGNVCSLPRLQKAAVIQDRGLRPCENSNGRTRRTHTAHLTGADPDYTSAESDEGKAYCVSPNYQSATQKCREQQKTRSYVDADGNNNAKITNGHGGDDKIRAMKARSFCSGRGRWGHWRKDAERPKSRANPDLKGVSVCNITPAEVYAVKHEGDLLMGIADTACASTMAGTQWLQQYADRLAKLNDKPGLHREREAFRFGTGKAHYSSFYVMRQGGSG